MIIKRTGHNIICKQQQAQDEKQNKHKQKQNEIVQSQERFKSFSASDVLAPTF